MTRKKRVKLGERAAKLLKKSDKPCTTIRRCAPLQAVIEVFDGRRPGISVEPFMDLQTGRSRAPRVVLFTRPHEFAELSYCPFCGEKVNVQKKASRMKMVRDSLVPQRV